MEGGGKRACKARPARVLHRTGGADGTGRKYRPSGAGAEAEQPAVVPDCKQLRLYYTIKSASVKKVCTKPRREPDRRVQVREKAEAGQEDFLPRKGAPQGLWGQSESEARRSQ